MSSSRPRVLIVDDDPDHLQLLAAALEAEYEVVTAADGLDGYAIACSNALSAIVLDVLMPLVDGWTVLRKLKANPATRNVRIVIVTALEADAVAQDAARLGVAAVLGKPVRLAEFKAAVGRAVAG